MVTNIFTASADEFMKCIKYIIYQIINCLLNSSNTN